MSKIYDTRMGIEQKSYTYDTAIAKPGRFEGYEAGANIVAPAICGINYADGLIYPIADGVTDGTEEPRFLVDHDAAAGERVNAMRNGEIWEDRIEGLGLSVEVKQKMADRGLYIIEASEGYDY